MADILIRNMKMPRGCFECPFDRFGDVRDRVTSCCLKAEHGEKCPLVELPEGHGTLGDLDALFKHLFLTDGGYIANDRDSDGWPHVCTYESIKKAILEAPTIVPVEGGTSE